MDACKHSLTHTHAYTHKRQADRETRRHRHTDTHMHTNKHTHAYILKYYLKHCRHFVWYIQLEVRVKWHIRRVLYLSRDSHQELYIPYKPSSSALSVLLYFALTKC